MTNLKETLHRRAESLAAPQIDVDQIVRSGNRRVRRARITTGLAVTAVTGVVAGSALVLPGLMPTPSREQNLAAAPEATFTERRVSYASGDVIHWGEESFSVGRPVSSYVQTDDGFVFTTKNGDVFLYDGTSAEQVGQAEGNRLRADDSGSLVTWLDRAEDGAPQFVIYDTAARDEVTRYVDDRPEALQAQGEFDGVAALDDGIAYFRNGPDLLSYDVESGREAVLSTTTQPADPAEKSEPVAISIADAAAGQLAYYVDAGDDWGLRVGEDIDTSDRTRTLAQASHGVLSPDAAYLGAEEGDNIAVYDVATGANVTPDLSSYPFAVPFGWVDDTTAMVFALEHLEPRDGQYVGDLMECAILAGQCDSVAELKVDPASFTLPVGDPMS